MEQILIDGFNEMGINLHENSIANFKIYYELLDMANKVMNLTAITGEEDTARLHFLDSCALLAHYDFSDKTVIDVGTGAGFPGLPIKIARPELKMTLVDSLQKRVEFLEDCCNDMELSGIDCIHARAEDAAQTNLRESHDIAVSRAVARLNVLCELCMPFIRIGGVFLALKGPIATEELSEAENAIEILGGKFTEIIPYEVAGTNLAHNIIVIEKIKETPSTYPRRWAKISKKPL